MSPVAADPPTRPPTAPAWADDDLRNPHAVADKAARVRRMFDEIAATYERVNTLTSLGRDRYWRRSAVHLAGVTAADHVLDVACGTGDLARAFAAGGAGSVVGVDFAEDMLRLAARRSIGGASCSAPVEHRDHGSAAQSHRDDAPATNRRDISAGGRFDGPRPPSAAIRGSNLLATGISWCLGDALRLPFADASFTVASCAFGVRNFQDLTAGLAEMARVLTPQGRAIILEFSLPRSPILRGAYRLYLEQVLPRVARRISGDRVGAYDYLARSVLSFVDEAGLAAALHAAGFAQVRRHRLTFGVVHVHVACKSSGTAGDRP